MDLSFAMENKNPIHKKSLRGIFSLQFVNDPLFDKKQSAACVTNKNI